MKNLYFALAFLVLSGCATVAPSFIRDGKQVYEAKCPGTARSIADCHKLASNQCKGSYVEMDKGSEVHGDYIKRSLLFTCKSQP